MKIQSENGYAFSGVPGPNAFNGNKLVDFVIPSNATYDLSKSYLNFNMSVKPIGPAGGAVVGADLGRDTALFNDEIVFLGDVANADAFVSDTASLVRNAQLQASNRGGVESIRRLDTLRQVLWALENDKKEKQDGLDKIGTFQGRRGTENRTSSLLQTVIRNVNNAGVADADPITGRVSRAISRDFRIPMSDIFGVGNAMWNGKVYGETRIHLEMNMDRLRIQNLGGAEDISNAPGAIAYGAVDNQNAQNPGVALTQLVMTATYKDYQLNFPFYVGQAINVGFTDSVSGAGTGRVIISSIDYNNNNNANPPGGDETITITTRSAWHTIGGGVANITAILIKAILSDLTTTELVMNKAEIVLNEMVGVDGPTEIDYRTYTTEEQTGLGATDFFHQYVVEPNAQNLIIATCLPGEITPSNAWNNYRLAIDNVDQTGNRSVVYNDSLHYDRILRFMNNRGQNISSIALVSIDCEAVQTNAANRPNQVSIFPILETLPIKTTSKTVTLQLNATAINDVLAYKEVVRTI